jgi:carboxypeptidase C (cathepsin A)
MPEATPAATPPAAPDTADKRRQRDAVERLLADPWASSSGTLTTATASLAYRVDAGFLPVRCLEPGPELGEAQAAVFSTAYQLQAPNGTAPEDDPTRRPVCFAFNGGPGASSVFLHLGALGPQRVRVHDDGTMPAPPYTVEPNPHSWFTHLDLVFVDPPHTGHSITASDEARKKMLSVDGDVAALAQVVQAWLSRHQRWGSPVILCGESYGTTRVAALAEALGEAGVALAGVVLVSCALDLQALDFLPRNDLPYATFLPAFAGTAQFHGCLKGSLGQSGDAARAAAQEFVDADYLRALHQGARLAPKEQARVARRLAQLTGLPQAFIERQQLRISDQQFFSELLRPRGQVVGRMDGRVAGPMPARQTPFADLDPSLDTCWAPYAMAAKHYFGQQLGLNTQREYLLYSPDAAKQWNWNRGERQGNAFTCTSTDLAKAVRRQPHLRVLVASGLFDLATPYSATCWTLDQLDLAPAQRTQLRHHTYGAGHMMYSRQADLEALKADLVAWLEQVPAGVAPTGA